MALLSSQISLSPEARAALAATLGQLKRPSQRSLLGEPERERLAEIFESEEGLSLLGNLLAGQYAPQLVTPVTETATPEQQRWAVKAATIGGIQDVLGKLRHAPATVEPTAREKTGSLLERERRLGAFRAGLDPELPPDERRRQAGEFRERQERAEEFYPSALQNIREGKYPMAALQGAAALADVGGLLTAGTSKAVTKPVLDTLQGLLQIKPRPSQFDIAFTEGQKLLGPAGSMPSPSTRGWAAHTERYDDLSRASERIARGDMMGGSYIGFPSNITTPQARHGLVTSYTNRSIRGLDSGIEPGYFYERGRQAIADVTSSPEEHRKLANLIAVTSTMVSPDQNLAHALRVVDQFAAGIKIRAGMYPNVNRPLLKDIMAGKMPWIGYKRDRYSRLLGPDVGAPVGKTGERAPASQATGGHRLSRLPPNDQVEGGAIGFYDAKGNAKPPSGATQVAAVDWVREQSLPRVNAWLKAQGRTPITLEELQEVHWATRRAETEGRPLGLLGGPDIMPTGVRATDTIDENLPGATYRANWETTPGKGAGHFELDMPGSLLDRRPLSKEKYAGSLLGATTDPTTGRDRFVGLMGDLQRPTVRGTGVWEGEPSPGFLSRHLVSQTMAHGLDPASAANVNFIEGLRQFALAQEARAGYIARKTTSPSQIDLVNFPTGRVPTERQTMAVEAMLVDRLGPGSATVVFDEGGFSIIKIDQGLSNKDFAQSMEVLSGDILKATGAGDIRPITKNRFSSMYEEMEWKGGKPIRRTSEGGYEPGTRQMRLFSPARELLDLVDDPNFPKFLEVADSSKTRGLMGDIASVYERLQAQGLQGNDALILTLRTWAKDGIPGIRKLVKQGLAPAGAVAIFSGLASQEPSQLLPVS